MFFPAMLEFAMNWGFLAVLAISLIAGAGARAQTSPVDSSNTYVVRAPGLGVAPTSRAAVTGPPGTAAPVVCPSNVYVRMDKLVCAASYSDVLATPEHFYGLEIYIDGYLTKRNDGLVLFPFTKPDPSPYEIIHVQVRPSKDIHKPPIPPRLLPKLENGSWVRVIGTFSRGEGVLKSSVGVLTDAHEIADITNDPQFHAEDTYLPDLRLKRTSSPSAPPPQSEIAPDTR